MDSWFSPETLAGMAFPAMVCVYLLSRLEGAFKELQKAVSCNNSLVRALLVKIGVDVEVLKEGA